MLSRTSPSLKDDCGKKLYRMLLCYFVGSFLSLILKFSILLGVCVLWALPLASGSCLCVVGTTPCIWIVSVCCGHYPLHLDHVCVLWALPLASGSCPYAFLSCKANARVKIAKTGHGPDSSTLVVICVVLWIVCV